MVTEMKRPLNSFNWVFNYFHIAFAFNIQFSSHKSSSFRCLILRNSSRPSSSCHDIQLDFKIRIICKTIHFHEKVKIKKQKNKIFCPNLCHAIAWKCWLPIAWQHLFIHFNFDLCSRDHVGNCLAIARFELLQMYVLTLDFIFIFCSGPSKLQV